MEKISRNFINRERFEQTVGEIDAARGVKYSDIETIYGDLSRLVVAWLANTPAKKIRAKYNKLGWKGEASARALHEAAKQWMMTFRPEGLVKGESCQSVVSQRICSSTRTILRLSLSDDREQDEKILRKYIDRHDSKSTVTHSLGGAFLIFA